MKEINNQNKYMMSIEKLNSKSEKQSDKTVVFTVNDLTEEELEWYNKRVGFFNASNVEAPTKLLLKILYMGRKTN
jgi:hypothetical protein